MKWVLDSNIAKKFKLSIEQVLMIALIQLNKDSPEKVIEQLIDKGLISVNYKEGIPCGYFTSKKANELLADIFFESKKDIEEVDPLDDLVVKLQNLYPKGKKPYTNCYWRGNKTDIKRKLRIFFERYGEDYTYEEILKATESYINSFNMDYSYMRALQYFIWKEEIKDGAKIATSELATFLERKDDYKDSLEEGLTSGSFNLV